MATKTAKTPVCKYEASITKDVEVINREAVQVKVEDKLIELDNDIHAAKTNLRNSKKDLVTAEANFHGTSILQARLDVSNCEKTLEGLRELREEFFAGISI